MRFPARALIANALAVAALLTAGGASAEESRTPFADISSPGPLTHVFVGNDLSCQVAYKGDRSYELYPPDVKPADCGTFISLGGGKLFGPDFEHHPESAASMAHTPFAAVSQTPPSGAGTKDDPFKVVTVATAPGTGIQITQTDSYVSGDLTYRTDVSVANSGPAINAILYRAGDCYLQESDVGFSFVRAAGSIGCSRNPDNFPPARVEQWVPITTTGVNYYEGRYAEIWDRIESRRVFPNLCRCLHAVDNGSGVSWKVKLPAGGTVVRSHYTTFSKNGVSGTPESADKSAPDVYISTGGKPLRFLKCVPARFNARVNALDVSPLLRVTIKLDGRVKLRTKKPLSSVAISVKPVHGARHRIDVEAKDSHGNEGTTHAPFRVC